ncbi:MAG TPA: replicative DNA helicase [Saprospiraceae bacterium]|nr:replicative DNA helicase [Saprospiraceae bacterium]HQW57281.1 replicative DNA helicase [Saprospiraceae bacterium]
MSLSKKPIAHSGSNLRPLNKSLDFSVLSQGKIVPQAIPVEASVLGAIMLDKNAMSAILDVLNPSMFYLPAHGKIFQAMMSIFNKTQPIDLLTVHEELKKSGEIDSIGGPMYLAELTSIVGSSQNIEIHARIIAQKHIQRELIKVSNNIITDCFEDAKDVFDLLDDAEKNLFSITDNNLRRSYSTFLDLATQLTKRLEEQKNKPEGITGVPTGFKQLDKLTSGWQKSDFIIIAARPSVGKTALIITMAVNAAKKGFPVAIFSLEMSTLQMAQRVVSMEARISSTSIRDGNLSDEELKRLHSTLQADSDLKLFIDDTPAINIFELRAKCRRLKMQHDIQMVVIDYLQLMSAGADSKNKGNREVEVASISRALKSIAKELDIPIIALSQLNRSVETRAGDKRPQLSDLRESGSIEQDADIVAFIYRPDMSGLVEDRTASKVDSELMISKHRNGALANIKMVFEKDYAKYVEANDYGFDNFSVGGLNSQFFTDKDNNPMIRKSSKANEDEDEIFDVPFND